MLNNKERERYALAEEYIRTKLHASQCMWEIARPKAAPRIAMLAGFLTAEGGLLILQVWKDGQGFEVYAAPKTNTLEGTTAAIQRMWDWRAAA